MTTKKMFFTKIIICALGALVVNSSDAAVVSRTMRPSVSARGTGVVQRTAATTDTPTTTVETPETDDTLDIVVEDKSAQFSESLSEQFAGSTNNDESELASRIREQKNAFNARDAQNIVKTQQQSDAANNSNSCDSALRKCMQSKCGKDYTECAGDTDTTWGNKMDSCRRETVCTGHEYALLAPEIKADRDMNARISGYLSVVNCGNSYNDCIVQQCGKTFEKCLGKSAGDRAIESCKKIAQQCATHDNGLAARATSVFGLLRTDAEKTVQRDEQRLYALRDEMANMCKSFGAMFDERTLDCIHTVEFFAGDSGQLFASKKLYAGSVFSCTPDWFGIDVTTFMDNAARLTREQKSASSAMLGAGVGVGVGAVTSGAIDRAVDRTQAQNKLRKAERANEKAEKINKKQSDSGQGGVEQAPQTPETLTNSTPNSTPTNSTQNSTQSSTQTNSTPTNTTQNSTQSSTTNTEAPKKSGNNEETQKLLESAGDFSLILPMAQWQTKSAAK